MANKPFNQLSDSQAERLAILAEECGEVVQIIGKILRHGRASVHPEGWESNNTLLEKELGDLMFILEMMYATGDIRGESVAAYTVEKADKIGKYLHHQDDAREYFIEPKKSS